MSLMSSYKGHKAEHVEVTDKWITAGSKSYSDSTSYHNNVTKKAKCETAVKNIQKDKNVKIPQVGLSVASSRKRKSCDDIQTKPAESSLKTGYNADKLPLARHNAHTRRNKIIAIRRSKTIKNCFCSSVHMKSTLSETDFQNTRKCDLILDKTEHTRTTKKFYVSDKIEKQLITEGNERTEWKQKTSAQSRLMSKRKQFEVEAKRILSSMGLDDTSNSLPESEKHKTVKGSHRMEMKYTSFNSISSVSDAALAVTRVRDRMRKRLKESREKVDYVNDGGTSNSVNDEGSMCLDEEMDWEPSEQEVMIEHIKTMRRNRGNVEELSDDIATCSNADMEPEHNENHPILVFDTNVFISCLTFIKDFVDTCIPGLGLARIFVPWRVLQELDHLKSSDIKPLQVSAIRAIRFLNTNFSSRHPRVCGQSFEEFTSLIDGSRSCPDDEILQVCLNLKQKNIHRMVMLITNDKNLESKAIVSGVEAFSKDRFVKDKLSDSNRKVSSFSPDSKARNILLKNDMVYCRLKGLLKKFLEQLLETELKNAFNKDWKKIVIKKAPWTLMDMFECLIKHWRSVFTFIFKKDVLTLVENLKEHFRKVEKGELVVVRDIAQMCDKLLTRMKDFVNDEKSYSKILNNTITEIERWIESKNTPNIKKVEEREDAVSLMPTTTSSHESFTIYNPQSPMYDVALCRDKVKNLFQIIWDEIKAFFCKISELAATNGMNNPNAVNEVKSQFPHVIRNVQELIAIVEKILSLGPEETSQANQFILHLSHFLVGLNVFHIDAVEMNNLPGYIGLFCSDNGGRVVLCSLINDLKQFAMGMMDGMKVLDRL